MEDRLKYDVLPDIDKIKIPVLLIVGEQDIPTPVKHQKIIYDKLQTEKELHKILTEKRESLRNFRFDTTGTKVKNVKEGLNTKKEISRILTELRVREIKGQ